MTPDPFPLDIPLTGSTLDRGAALRAKPAKLALLLLKSEARSAIFWNGKPLIDLRPAEGPGIAWREMSDHLSMIARTDPILLGLEEGAPRYARALPPLDDAQIEAILPEGHKFIDFRSIAGDLAPGQASLLAQARSMSEWHMSHRYCARCGEQSDMAEGGWRRDCPSCGAKHFPRTDPVVIALAIHHSHEHGERVLLGRQPQFLPELHSLLAGYVEPGETIEEATRRELHEEAGVSVGQVRYLGSQPWPFPSTLMLGVYAEVLDDRLTPDYDELETCLWMSKADVQRALRGELPGYKMARRDAIARSLISAWAEDRLTLAPAQP
ncbi:MAG: NAD(+) diphosphatase [Neomegalonema sp.]|nr:NAD(+) diphosphatase [Neomegalonema sp.]